jgi:bifunctional non-homologous end joining protein LigD
VAPYAVRAKKGAPIAAPINRNELSDNNLNPQSFNIKNILQRLEQKNDPWANINKNKNSLSKAEKLLGVLTAER